MKKISILSKTRSDFSNDIKTLLGKGGQHAEVLYSNWFRTGTFDCSHSMFKNAPLLANEILENVDAILPQVSKVIEEGETTKFLTRMHDGLEVESVIIPMKFGWSLCVSSQVGCRMGCSFCQTGRMGLLRNLTSAEITAQLYLAKHHFKKNIRNVVFMGMGEPMDNFDNVKQAIHVMTDAGGFSIAKSHITLSTVGRIDGILRFKEEMDPAINLAVSLNSSNSKQRTPLMPLTRKYSMEALKEVLIDYCSHPRRELLLGYILIKGVTDQLNHADELAEYIKGLKARINLIPYNAQASDPYQSPDQEAVEAFASRLRKLGVRTYLRITKGDGIMAACGQLGTGE